MRKARVKAPKKPLNVRGVVGALPRELLSRLAVLWRREGRSTDHRLLHEISGRSLAQGNMGALLGEILGAVMAIARAPSGNVQLFDAAAGKLVMSAHRGLTPGFVEHFQRVAVDESTSCGAAFKAGRRVVVPDTRKSDTFAGTPAGVALEQAGVRAVQSTPLISRSGALLGMMSTHWKVPHRPTAHQLELIDLLARQAADLVEQKRAEAALRESEERYRTLFESIDEGFCIIEMLFDGDGQPVDYLFVEHNPAFERHTGLQDPVGKTARELVPNLDEFWFEIYGRVALTGTPARFESPAAAMGRWYDVYAFRVGRPEQRRVALLFNDISERKRAEAAQREAARRKDEFLATLAHELRNPLAPLASGVALVRMAGDRPVDPEVGEVMERQVRHMTRLVDDLLEVSRITRGSIELRRERVELASVLQVAVDTSRPAIEAAQHTLTVDVPPGPVVLHADPVRLTQVFANLLNNAAKYMVPGGRIWLTATCEGDSAVVSVRDAGVGIPQDMLASVFEMFRQVHHAPSEARDGLGIGLTLAHSLVRMHGGDIEARSEGPGKGSEFVVRLPCVGAAERPAAEAAAIPSTALASCRVLVVDDNRDAADSLAALLDALGARTETHYDGASALATLDCGTPPDVVVLDIGMPGMDGYEVARQIRRRNGAASPVLVALTGWGAEADRQRALEAGFDHHLLKPANLAALRGVLESVGAAADPS
jgi:PAS domain S-box-containing protein